jgi:hypothetical protein
LDHRVFNQETEIDEEEKEKNSKLFVEVADAEAPDFLLPPERGSVLFCINAALRCFGVDPRHCIRYKYLEMQCHRWLDYV